MNEPSSTSDMCSASWLKRIAGEQEFGKQRVKQTLSWAKWNCDIPTSTAAASRITRAVPRGTPGRDRSHTPRMRASRDGAARFNCVHCRQRFDGEDADSDRGGQGHSRSRRSTAIRWGSLGGTVYTWRSDPGDYAAEHSTTCHARQS